MSIYFKTIQFKEAAELIASFHYEKPSRGDYCFGLLKDSELLAAVVFINSRSNQDRIGELVSMGRNDIQRGFHMSQLVARASFFLKPTYDIILTYCDSLKGSGTTFQGASWCYHGKTVPGNYSMDPIMIYDGSPGWHMYWRALNVTGYNRARTYNLKSLRYPRNRPKFNFQNEARPNA